jgi:hypothetical protein
MMLSPAPVGSNCYGFTWSILASQEILDDLPRERRLDFTSIRLDRPEKLVYAYAPATRQGLRNLAERHATDHEPMEAAHCAYREAGLCLAVGDPANAVEAFAKAIRWMDDTPEDVRHRYFWRTLKGFYEGWKLLLEEAPRSLSSGRWEDRREFLASNEARTFFGSSSTRTGIGNLLSHMEYILEQLDILAQKVVNEPAGLTTLEMCLLLQRCGYSRRYESHLINKRLERIQAEIAENHHRSIDGDCSLCTGAAASCLLLAGDTKRANDLLDWLSSLKGVRYSCIEDGSTNEYGDIPFGEHSLHYASVAMCGFADDPRRMDDAESVKSVLLSDEWDKADGLFPAHWMRYRNINEYEVCGYILPALVRYWLSGGTFENHEKKRCAQVLDTLAEAVIAEAQRAERPQRPERLYAARENIGSFALAMVPGIGLSDRAETLARRIFSAFTWRLQWIKTRPSVRRQTLDSVPDRARKFLNGWMLQWEMILRADPHTLPSYAGELFEQPSAAMQPAPAPLEPYRKVHPS